MYTENISIMDTLEITLVSMMIVFSILILLSIMVSLFKYLPNSERLNKKFKRKKRSFVNFDKMDEDMQVAALVATIDYREEIKGEVRLKSIKRI
jgi:hypothetical protein